MWVSQKKIARMVGDTTEGKIKGAVIIQAKEDTKKQECDKSLQMEQVKLDVFFLREKKLFPMFILHR